MIQQSDQRIHGGPDAFGVPAFDFSSNSNACGPCPSALAGVLQADATLYPDASYTALRTQLAAFHRVDAQRMVLAASSSEFIMRITAMVARRGGCAIGLPPNSYSDYAHAAGVHGLARSDSRADLYWACEPSSPLGQSQADWPGAHIPARVLDRAYEPLRLSGRFAFESELHRVWQLYSPNKALGLTGVRAAYAIAPADASADVQALNALCPSWPIGAHGVAMLNAWTQSDAQDWLAASLHTLRQWKTEQVALCESFGWTVLPSLANFFVCCADVDVAEMRQHGIKLRDCASFGLAGHVRMSVQSPSAQSALHNAWQHTRGNT